jgi:hypothetical protein
MGEYTADASNFYHYVYIFSSNFLFSCCKYRGTCAYFRRVCSRRILFSRSHEIIMRQYFTSYIFGSILIFWSRYLTLYFSLDRKTIV